MVSHEWTCKYAARVSALPNWARHTYINAFWAKIGQRFMVKLWYGKIVVINIKCQQLSQELFMADRFPVENSATIETCEWTLRQRIHNPSHRVQYLITSNNRITAALQKRLMCVFCVNKWIWIAINNWILHCYAFFEELKHLKITENNKTTLDRLMVSPR